MTPQELMTGVLFLLAIIGAVAAFWWRVEGKVKGADDKADSALRDLAAHKLHVAESYITKAGMREVKEEIMGAIHDVKSSVDHLGGRIDGIYAHNSTQRPARKTT
jgi:hypothetical protein